MLKKIGGFVGAAAVVIGGIAVKGLLAGGGAFVAHSAASAYNNHESMEKAYDDIEREAKTCFGNAGKQLDSVTTMNSCFFDRTKPEIIYNAVISYKAADLDIQPSDIETMRSELLFDAKNKLAPKEVAAFKTIGMLLTYNYYSVDAKLLMSITLKAQDL